MRNQLLNLIVLIGVSLACSVSLSNANQVRSGVMIYRVFPVFESEGSRRVARSELGCDPCTQIVRTLEDGGLAAYLLNSRTGLKLERAFIHSIEVEKTDSTYVVSVVLTELGRKRIEVLATSPLAEAANFVNENLVGIVPLRVFDDRYVLAFVPTIEAAEEIRRTIRNK